MCIQWHRKVKGSGRSGRNERFVYLHIEIENIVHLNLAISLISDRFVLHANQSVEAN